MIPNVAAACATRPGDRRCIPSFPRIKYSRNDHATLPIFQIVPMSFRVCGSFLHILRVVQIMHVLHMFDTYRSRCTIRDFCLHTIRFEIEVFVLAQFASCPYCQHLIFLIPWTRFGHFVHVVTRHHPFLRLDRSTVSRGTFLMFHVSLYSWFLLHVLGINAS